MFIEWQWGVKCFPPGKGKIEECRPSNFISRRYAVHYVIIEMEFEQIQDVLVLI